MRGSRCRRRVRDHGRGYVVVSGNGSWSVESAHVEVRRNRKSQRLAQYVLTLPRKKMLEIGRRRDLEIATPEFAVTLLGQRSALSATSLVQLTLSDFSISLLEFLPKRLNRVFATSDILLALADGFLSLEDLCCSRLDFFLPVTLERLE